MRHSEQIQCTRGLGVRLMGGGEPPLIEEKGIASRPGLPHSTYMDSGQPPHLPRCGSVSPSVK